LREIVKGKKIYYAKILDFQKLFKYICKLCKK